MVSAKTLQPIKNAKNYFENNKGLSGLANIGNTSHVNAMIQILAQIPSIRYFYRALQQKANQHDDPPPGSAKKFSYLLAQVLDNIWSGTWKTLKPNV